MILEFLPDSTRAEEILNSYDGNRFPLYEGHCYLFLGEDHCRWIVMDNTTGDCWTEEFWSIMDAIAYAYGMIDSDGCMEESWDDPFPDGLPDDHYSYYTHYSDSDAYYSAACPWKAPGMSVRDFI